ncbi:cell division protein DivIC [Dysgonomonas sp. PFB1-18]|uniref:FtsB family cell division protein n=1 Tax=unclassified Dysgonomonas TaxID=2630389 RepID=UPI0024737EA0|nr:MULTISPECIES: septum formation initiator family protein [unclassified Dysgonomonas]MDH6310880.1 cell division protein DivIC [Dysgonomonas sp. PF1-14]MDH6340682.1 cell division protein DivIC [Dysgonomonas sp. PF1-16]MDH6382350.1 cell division protein DivIC [Dysgonomonas sp. PFB1-18]MDH6399700.1 cell division protein DivIC [Dysgonomonas sp. PF1-23]
MNFLKSIFRYLTTRYTKIQLLIMLVIIVFAFFISESNIFARLGYDNKIRELNGQIEYYRDKTVEDKQKLKELESDKDRIEKFARENYLMKRENEDVFIVE